jgi:pimeloyl-ACP methyl ester carboxylesterase
MTVEPKIPGAVIPPRVFTQPGSRAVTRCCSPRGMLDALGAETAAIAGHDWGAPVAWHAARMRPDLFRGVIGLSVPFRPRGASPPTAKMPQNDEALFYQLYFQAPGVAEAELERDPHLTIRAMLFGASGEGWRLRGPNDAVGMVPRKHGFLRGLTSPPPLPPWLTQADVDFYVDEFSRTGFRGGLNWYRNIDRSWELLAPFAGLNVNVPALYVAGDRDLVMYFPGMDRLLPNLSKFAPKLRKTIVLPGCGHWTQQEQPAEVNAAMIEFLRGLSVA